jgi:hypothetical protein
LANGQISDPGGVGIGIAVVTNTAPVLTNPGDKTVDELTNLAFTLLASDSDVPAQTPTYTISSGSVAGMSLNSSTGAFSWTPTEAQGPGSYPVTFRVTDNGTPSRFDEKSITLTVNEVNVAPTLAAIGNKTVDALTFLTFTAVGSDTDIPANTLTYSLVNGTTSCGSVTSCTVPIGAAINGSTGAFTWPPTEAQAPGTYRLQVKVTDNGTPNLSAEKEFTVTVNPVTLTTDGRLYGVGFIDEGGTHQHFVFSVAQVRSRISGRLEYWVNDQRRCERDDDFDRDPDFNGDHDRDYGRDHRSSRNHFEATSVLAVVFSNDPAFAPGRGRQQPTVDTVRFGGAGKWNGRTGYTFEVVATDRGEPGRHRDTFSLIVRDSQGKVVANVSGGLDGGNIQSTRLGR